MKLRIMDSEKRAALEASWRESGRGRTKDGIVRYYASYFANQYVGECEGELGAERCFIDLDQCPGCGHHKTCAVRGLRIAILNAIDFSGQQKEGGVE